MSPSTQPPPNRQPQAGPRVAAAATVASRTADAARDGASSPHDAAAPAPQGRVRGQRLEITSADLTMYSVITGRKPSNEERQRALTWGERDPLHAQIAAAAALPIQALRPWHPAALSLRLRDLWFNGLTIRTARPHVSQWVRRLSGALHQGRHRMR